MTRCGASASWRKNSLSAGISPIVSRLVPRERMWKLSRQTPSAGWSAASHEPPGVVVLADVAAPGERLVGDAEPARRGPLGERPQLRRGEGVVVDRVGRDVRADEDQVGPEVLHHVELRLRPAQVALELVRRHRLEVAERLVEVDGQAEVVGQRAHLARRERRADEVVLEDLDAVEAGARRRRRASPRACRSGRRWRSPYARATSASPTSAAKWRSMRSRSGSRPVKRANESAAWKTAMPPPSSVRQPSCRAWRSSSVSSGR